MTLRSLETIRDFVAAYPSLVGHMICQSLGYFSISSAGNALRFYKADKPFGCEWYAHICDCKGVSLWDEKELKQVNKEVISSSFARRKEHKGYMAEYRQAKALIQNYLASGDEPKFASWF